MPVAVPLAARASRALPDSLAAPVRRALPRGRCPRTRTDVVKYTYELNSKECYILYYWLGLQAGRTQHSRRNTLGAEAHARRAAHARRGIRAPRVRPS